MKVKIRSATEKDFDFIFESIKEIVTIEGSDLKRAQSYTPKITKAISRSEIKIAVSNKKAVGFIWYKITKQYFLGVDYSPLPKKYLWISWVYVKPEYRHKGVATTLYKHIEEVAKTKSIEEILCDVYTTNKKSNMFHKKRNFKEIYKIYSKKIKVSLK